MSNHPFQFGKKLLVLVVGNRVRKLLFFLGSFCVFDVLDQSVNQTKQLLRLTDRKIM